MAKDLIVVACFFGGIVLGFLAREGYRGWQESRALEREWAAREALLNLAIQAAIILAVSTVIDSRTQNRTLVSQKPN